MRRLGLSEQSLAAACSREALAEGGSLRMSRDRLAKILMNCKKSPGHSAARIISYSELKAISAALSVSIEWLVGQDDNKDPATQVYGQHPTYTVPEPQFELSPQTNQEVAEPSNRLYASGDAGRAPAQKLMRYDASGNLVHDAHTDADGRRVRRKVANEEWWQPTAWAGSCWRSTAPGRPRQLSL
jgi:hypothetical protein